MPFTVYKSANKIYDKSGYSHYKELLSTSTFTATPIVTNPSPYHWWLLGEASGSTAYDNGSGTHKNMSVNGSLTLGNSPAFGNYSYYAHSPSGGSGSKLTTSVNAEVIPTGGMSLSLWHRIPTGYVYTSRRVMVQIGWTKFALLVSTLSGYKYGFYEWSGRNEISTNYAISNDNVWRHIVILLVPGATNYLKMYVNNNLEYTGYYTPNGNTSEDGVWYLLDDAWNEGNIGQMLDVRYYNEIITTNTISWLYNGGNGQTAEK
jgi:hypothetical protein